MMPHVTPNRSSQYSYRIDPDDPIYLSVELYEQAFERASEQLQEDMRLASQQVCEILQQQTERQIAQADRRVNAIINQGAEYLVAQFEERSRLHLQQLEDYLKSNSHNKSGNLSTFTPKFISVCIYAAILCLLLGAWIARIWP